MLEAPARKIILQMHTPARTSQCWSRQTRHGLSVRLDAPGQRQRHGQQSFSGTADPGVVKQDKSSGGSVDTTETRSGPQRVRMSSGERPIGAAKGKQPDTEALCQPPPPPRTPPLLQTIAGKNEIHKRENLVGPFLVHKLLGPKPLLLILPWAWPPSICLGTPPGGRGRGSRARPRLGDGEQIGGLFRLRGGGGGGAHCVG